MLESIRRLFSHFHWANECILAAMGRQSSVPSEALQEMGHVLGASNLWLSRIRARAPELPVWPELSIEHMLELESGLHQDFSDLVAEIDEPALERVVAYTNSANQSFETALGEILLHTAMHAQYHRGKINRILREAGLDPAPVDYIAYVRGVPAAVTPVTRVGTPRSRRPGDR